MDILANMDKGFSEMMTGIMADHKIGQSSLARLLKISKAHLSDLLAGKRNATPKMIDRITDKLKLSEEATNALHTAGAKDRGYRL